MQIPRGVRRRLRAGLGSRTQRRSGIKSMIVPIRSGRPAKPAARLKLAISRWLEEQG